MHLTIPCGQDSRHGTPGPEACGLRYLLEYKAKYFRVKLLQFKHQKYTRGRKLPLPLLSSYWEPVLSGVQPSTSSETPAPIWCCPHCNGPMMLIEKLTTEQIRRKFV